MKRLLAIVFLIAAPVGATTRTLFNGCTGCSDYTYAPDSTSIIGAFSGCSGTEYLGADGACHAAASGGASSLAVFVNGVQASSPTQPLGFQGPGVSYTNSGTSTTVTISGQATLPLPGGDTSYVQANATALQSNATAYISSMTIANQLVVGSGNLGLSAYFNLTGTALQWFSAQAPTSNNFFSMNANNTSANQKPPKGVYFSLSPTTSSGTVQSSIDSGSPPSISVYSTGTFNMGDSQPGITGHFVTIGSSVPMPASYNIKFPNQEAVSTNSFINVAGLAGNTEYLQHYDLFDGSPTYTGSPIFGNITINGTCTGTGCGTGGGGGSTNGTITASPMGQVGIYSLPGTTTTIAGTALMSVFATSVTFPTVSSMTETGFSSVTASGVYFDVSASTLNAGLVYLNGSAGNSGQFLESQGSGAASIWATPASGGGGSSTSTVLINGVILSSPTTSYNYIPGNGETLTGTLAAANSVNLTFGPNFGSTNTWTANQIISSATIPILNTSTLTVSGTGSGTIIETISGSTYTVIAGTGGVAGGCMEQGAQTGLYVNTGTGCGTGSGGASGTISVTPQYQVPFMALASSNVITSSANFTNNGTSITISSLGTITQNNVTTETARGVLFDYATSSFTNFAASTITVTNAIAYPTGSHDFGRSYLTQWFTAEAQEQKPFNPGGGNNLSIFAVGDSHIVHGNILNGFADWMNTNFGLAGTWITLSTASFQNNTMRPNGCTFGSSSGTWTDAEFQSSSLGLDDDEVNTTSLGSNLYSTCPGSDRVILHYVSQPNGGTISFTVDSGTPHVLSTAQSSIILSSDVYIAPTGYGVHTASISYTATGSAGVSALDWVYYSSSTPGGVIYAVGSDSMRLRDHASQSQAQLTTLASMMPAVPQIILLESGVNEAADGDTPSSMIGFAHTLMTTFRAAWPNAGCAYMTPPDFIGSANKTYPLSAYSQAWSNAAVADGCALIDFSAYFSSEPYFANYYQADGIHLNTQGGLVASNLIIHQLSNEANNIIPFTFNASSNVMTWGTDISTTPVSNVNIIGKLLTISSGVTNSGGIGDNLIISSNNVFYLGGSGNNGQNLIVSSITVYGISATTVTIIDKNASSTNALYVATQTAGAFAIAITTTNHMNFGSPSPTVGTCGTTPTMLTKSTDHDGAVTWSGNATLCGFTFSKAWVSTPFCLANLAGGTTIYAGPVGVSASSATFQLETGVPASTMTYHCFGGSGG